MIIREATEADIPAITAIYNDAVVNTTAIWNDVVVDEENRREWMNAKIEAGFPLLVAESGGGVLGYATYGPFRSFDGYKHTVENSIYVASNARGRGVGGLLVDELVNEARERGVHVIVAAIEAGNAQSISLHEKRGFISVGLMPEVGTKFGRWLDLALLQKVLG